MNQVKHESKTIRPFLHADEMRHAFGSSSLRLKAGDEFSTSEAFVIRDEDRTLLEPAILPLIDRSAAIAFLQQIGLAEQNVRISVIATSHEMRLSETLTNFSLEELPEAPIELRPKLNRFLSSKGGCEISIIMMVADDLPPQPLKPHYLGQWLCKKTFALKPEQPSNEFRILPLTEAARLRLRLPEETLHYVEMAGGTLNDPDAKLENCLTIWVSEPIFNALSRDDASRTSAAIQKMLLSEITLTIVIEEIRNLEEVMPEPKSPLDGFFTDLAKSSGVKKELLVQYAKATGNKALLGAYIQKMLEVNGAIRAAV